MEKKLFLLLLAILSMTVQAMNKGKAAKWYLEAASKTNTIQVDAKTQKKADELYRKGIKHEGKSDYVAAFKKFQEAAKLGHIEARVREALYLCNGKRGVRRNEELGQQMVDNLVLMDDSQVWQEIESVMSREAKAYVEWRRGKKQDVPYRFISRLKGKEMAKRELKKSAEDGNIIAQKDLGIQLWSGEFVPQDKQEAVKWLKTAVNKFNPDSFDQMEIRDRLIVAKGENYYHENIPVEWYSGHGRYYIKDDFIKDAAKGGNKEAELALAYEGHDMNLLTKEVEKGNRRAAELLSLLLQKSMLDRDETMLMLLESSSKTGFDKYKADAELIQEIYQDAIAFVKDGNEEKYNDRKGFPKEFVRFYSKYPKYDKQGMLKKARTLANLSQVCYAFHLRDDPSFWDYEGRGAFGLTRTPVWNKRFEESFFGYLNDGIDACRKSASDPVLGSFFKQSLPKLNAKLTKIRAYSKSDRDKYEAAVDKLSAETRRSSSRSSSNRSGSSGGSSSVRSTSSNSSKTYSCKVHLVFQNGGDVYKGSCKAWFKGFGNTASQEFKTDSKGNATISWPDSKGEIINAIFLEANIGFNGRCTKEGLKLENGGNYTVCMDCE